MGEPGQNPGIINSETFPDDKFEVFPVISGVRIHVYWHPDLESYVIEFPTIDLKKPEVEKAMIILGPSDKFAEEIFENTKSLAFSIAEGNKKEELELFVQVEQMVNKGIK